MTEVLNCDNVANVRVPTIHTQNLSPTPSKNVSFRVSAMHEVIYASIIYLLSKKHPRSRYALSVAECKGRRMERVSERGRVREKGWVSGFDLTTTHRETHKFVQRNKIQTNEHCVALSNALREG